jgi:hypothetical protein
MNSPRARSIEEAAAGRSISFYISADLPSLLSHIRE